MFPKSKEHTFNGVLIISFWRRFLDTCKEAFQGQPGPQALPAAQIAGELQGEDYLLRPTQAPKPRNYLEEEGWSCQRQRRECPKSWQETPLARTRQTGLRS